MAALPDSLTGDDLARHATALHRLARALVSDDASAEDLAQDALLIGLEHPPKHRGALSGWLATVVRRLALDRSRSELRRLAREVDSAREEAQASHVVALERLEIGRSVLEEVLSLREPYRTTVYLRYWEGIEPAAIAERLGVPVKSVHSRLSRAIEELRERLDAKSGGDRGRWLSVLLPFVTSRSGAMPGSGTGLAPSVPIAWKGVAGGVLMLKKAAIVLAVVAIGLLAWRIAGSHLWRAGETQVATAHIESAARTPTGESTALERPTSQDDRAIAVQAAVAPPKTTGSLVVVLRHPTRAPATNVSIDARCSADPAPREEFFRERTDQEGRARFPALFAGTVRLFTDRGWQYETSVVAGEEREVEFSFSDGITVAGHAAGPKGEPISGAEIWIEGVAMTSARAHLAARTAADGTFRLDDLAPRACVGARAAGMLPSDEFNPESLPLATNGVRTVTLELQAGGAEVEGRVVDSRGLPIVGALVKIGPRGGFIVDLANGLRGTAPKPVPVATDADGHFFYAGAVPVGEQPMCVQARGWPRWEGTVTTRAGERNHVDVALQKGATIDGRVVDKMGKSVEGARVIASAEERGGWFHDEFPAPEGKTDAQGRFRLDWVAPGNQEINASLWDHPELGRAKAQVTCREGQNTSVELVLDPGLTISGHVVDGAGLPLAGWRVYATATGLGNAYPRESNTDEQGSFLLANLDSKVQYRLQARPRGGYASPAPAEIASVDPGASQVEIVVKHLSTADAHVLGRLLGEDGHPPVDVKLVYYPEGSGEGRFVEFDGTSGAFDCGPLPQGKYDLRVMRGGHTIHRTALVEIHSGETTDIGEIRLSAPGDFDLRISGIPAEDLSRLRPELDRDGYSTESLSFKDGSFRSRPLGAGTWLLDQPRGQRGWFVPAAKIEIRPAETTRVELHAEPAYPASLNCTFDDPEAKWTKLKVQFKDHDGEVVRTFDGLDRTSMKGNRLQIGGLPLPTGHFEVEVCTETGIRGSASIDVGLTFARGPATEIVMR